MLLSKFLLSPDEETAQGDEERAGAQNANSSTEDEEVAALKKELEAANAKATENYDRLLRTAADFDNTRKRLEREKDDIRKYGHQDFAKDLLPVIDAFDKAMSAIDEANFSFDTEEGKKMAAIVEGIQLVSKSFSEALKKHGVERVPGKGHPFDPMYHNAVARVVDSQVSQETVLDEFVPGYKIGDRVLRTAMVRVATRD